MRILITLLLYITLSTSSSAVAIEQLDIKKSSTPIEILSDEVRYLNEESKAIFTGKVEATQDDYKMWCNEMVVLFSKGENKPSSIQDSEHASKIDKILLNGDVKIQTKEDTATSSYGEYSVADDIFILKENVVLIQQDNKMFGDELIYRRKTGESLLKSHKSTNNQRVKAIIIPESQNKDAHIKSK